ncbi:hypothetical protein [Streptomyces sp. NPDC057253]|uniref:hypothetical protein n=1 Tax=Streptomyces sp. NPDC057253 TaxID=3346069 RepID=UPI00362FFB23
MTEADTLVPGPVVLLMAGDRVAADGRLIVLFVQIAAVHLPWGRTVFGTKGSTRSSGPCAWA